MANNKNKTDPKLGKEIHKMLVEKGVETPMLDNMGFELLDEAAMIKFISDNMRSTMNVLGLDLTNDSLQDTPDRVAKMYVQETFYGLSTANFPKCTLRTPFCRYCW